MRMPSQSNTKRLFKSTLTLVVIFSIVAWAFFSLQTFLTLRQPSLSIGSKHIDSGQFDLHSLNVTSDRVIRLLEWIKLGERISEASNEVGTDSSMEELFDQVLNHQWVPDSNTFPLNSASKYFASTVAIDHRIQFLLKQRREQSILKSTINNNLYSHDRIPRSSSNPVRIYSTEGAMMWPHLLRSDVISRYTSKCPIPCEFLTTGGGENADVILNSHYHGTFDFKSLKPHQRLALLVTEPHPFYMENIQAMLHNTDILVSFSVHSEVQISYYYALSRKDIVSTAYEDLVARGVLPATRSDPIPISRPPVDKSILGLASTVISNCGAYPRSEFILELEKLVKLDHYGNCWHNTGSKGSDRGASDEQGAKLKYLKMYKFALIFENSILSDYVTEKLYDGIMSNVLVVYMGGTNLNQWFPFTVPEPVDFKSPALGYIHALAYTPEELARLLIRLNNDEDAYASYFEWKRRAPSELNPYFQIQKDVDFVRGGSDSWVCRLCSYYHDNFGFSVPTLFNK